jgi:two-component system, chemotaxis family, sensor kinase CheA
VSTRDERRRALVLQFQAVAAERLSKLSRAWVEVERRRGGPHVDELLRELHTLKGEARVVGYTAAASRLHELESVLGEARERKFPPERAVSEAVLGVLDAVTDQFSRAPDPKDEGPPATAALLERASEALLRWGTVAPKTESATPGTAPPPALPPTQVTPGAFVRVTREKVEGLSELTDELLVLRGETNHAVPEMRAAAGRLESAVQELAPLLGPSAAWLAGAVRSLAQQISDHEDTLYRAGLAVDALDAAVREIRFVQASTLLDAYPRYVREMAVAGGKMVQLELDGESVEADRRVLEHLREPLLHVVRNAVDHGIEAHGDRVRAGKAPAGTLRLAVAQQGGRLTVEAQDDGRGIDPARIKARAVELGMITEVQARAMGEPEALDLVFAAGFSMRRTADELSGRGIGMDVVKRRVEQIGGRVELQSRPGLGTRVRLTAPLSVSVTRALLLEQGSETYAVPAASVDAVRRITSAEVSAVPGGRVLRHGDALLPVRRLWEEVRGAQGAPEICVVLRSGQDRVALLADAATREADLIVRPIEAPLGSMPLVAGAALMGSGRLVLLLEPAEMVRGAEVRGPGQPLPEGRKLQVLVVEDSVIFQSTLSDLLRSRGHRVALASNGLEGLERALSVRPDIVITDIEMPRMNGLELIRAMRKKPELRKVPVITLSALGSREVRAEAIEAGADHYLTKSELDEEYLLDLVRSLTA